MSTLNFTEPVARPSPVGDHDLAALVRQALGGDPAALTRIVERYDGSLRAIARFYRLAPCDVDDAVQTTWLLFLEHGHSLREPAALKGWLATTARRQCLRTLQRHVREQPSEDPALAEAGRVPDPCEELIAAQRRATLHGAVARLPASGRRLMLLMIARPDLSYDQVGAALGIPIGSIGPTRQRAISRLGQMREIRALGG